MYSLFVVESTKLGKEDADANSNAHTEDELSNPNITVSQL